MLKAGDTTHAFMVAHRIGKPAKLSLLRLRRTNSTTDGHLIHGTNEPWHFEFCSRKVAAHSCLDFDLDIVCLIAVAETCQHNEDPHISEVNFRRDADIADDLYGNACWQTLCFDCTSLGGLA